MLVVIPENINSMKFDVDINGNQLSLSASDIIEAVVESAVNLRAGAELGGDNTDGGCRKAITALNLWLIGLMGEMPMQFSANVYAMRHHHPEYKEYLRLKKLFEK